MKRLRQVGQFAAVALLVSSGGCQAAAGSAARGDVTVMFIGNSLTYGNDMPTMVRDIAGMNGRAITVVSLTRPNYSLEDHWQAGAADSIRRRRPDFVVLQQGPSAAADSRTNLITWARRFSDVVRSSGGTPVLYMVWPGTQRRAAFPAVIESYSQAATASGAQLAPAGRAFELLENAGIDLYESDGFHPSRAGSLAAALTIHATIFEADPASSELGDAALNAAILRRIRDAVAASMGVGTRR